MTMTDPSEFLSMLLSTSTPTPSSLHGRFDGDHIQEWIDAAATAPFDTLRYSANTEDVSYRWGIRALSATLYGKTLDEASVRIHRMLGNKDLSVGDVKDILRGRSQETAFPVLQAIGEGLTNGKSITQTAAEAGVDRDTVSRVDAFLGIRKARKDRLIGVALSFLNDGTFSQRTFARRFNLSAWESRTLAAEARQIQKELANA